MNIYISKIMGWFSSYPKAKEWVWFAVLWFVGLLAVLLLSGTIEFIMVI